MLLEFEFDFQHKIDLENIVTPKHLIWSRSLYDVLFKDSNLTNAKLQFVLGHINQKTIENTSQENKLGSQSKTQGNKIFLNKEADIEKTISYLAEIFSFTKSNLKKGNSFLLKRNPSFLQSNSQNIHSKNQYKFFEHSSEFWYGNDPSDFFCSETFQSFQRILGCQGQQGIYKILDADKIFQSDYLAITGDLFYERESSAFGFKLNIQIVIQKIYVEQTFQKQEIQHCPIYNSSKIMRFTDKQEEIFDLARQKTIQLNIKNIFFQQNENEKEFPSKVSDNLIHDRYWLGTWFDFNGFVVREFHNSETTNTMKLVFYEYFPYYTLPIFHKIKIFHNTKQIEINKNCLFHIEKLLRLGIHEEFISVRFECLLKSQSSLKIEIPVRKMMKSFEDYPHDPGKGHYLISTPIFYQSFTQDNKGGEISSSESGNILIKIPEPDFSMPFNILTFSMVAFGYVFMSVFLITIEKNKEHWLFKSQKKQSLLQKILQKFFKKKEKAE